MILFIAFAGNAIAHRTTDLKIVLEKPTSSTVLTSGGTFDLKAVVTNLGPAEIKSTTDSILYFTTIQNSVVTINGGAYWLRHSRQLKVNDTVHLGYNGLQVNYTATADSQRTVCMYVSPVGPSTDTIADPNISPIATSNNRACVTFTWKKTVGINDVQGGGTNNVKIFPNPVQGDANISFESSHPAEVTLAILDLTGRKVASVNKGQMGSGTHTLQFSTSHLAPGIYIYELTVGNDMTAARFTVQ